MPWFKVTRVSPWVEGLALAKSTDTSLVVRREVTIMRRGCVYHEKNGFPTIKRAGQIPKGVNE